MHFFAVQYDACLFFTVNLLYFPLCSRSRCLKVCVKWNLASWGDGSAQMCVDALVPRGLTSDVRKKGLKNVWKSRIWEKYISDINNTIVRNPHHQSTKDKGVWDVFYFKGEAETVERRVRRVVVRLLLDTTFMTNGQKNETCLDTGDIYRNAHKWSGSKLPEEKTKEEKKYSFTYSYCNL